MSRIRGKITDVLRLQPQKPCDALTNEELIAEESRCRRELVRLVLSLSIHIGTCTTHGVLSAGTTLPIHVPVVVWVAYSLTKVAKRHKALRAEIRTNRPHVQLEKLKVKRFALPVVLGLISPVLSALGADILNDIVLTLVGTDTLCSVSMPGKGDFVSFSGDSAGSSDAMQVVTAGDEDNQFSITETVSQEAIQALFERWAEHIEKGAPEDFARLVADLEPESISDRAGVILPSGYQVYCDYCKEKINNGFSCTECHEFDLCRECYVGMKHKDARIHDYEEFKIEEEITQIQRIMASLRRGNIAIASRRGGYVQCNKCTSVLSTPSTNLKSNPVYYYTCQGCEDFDVCLKCFQEEVSSPMHKGHTFIMTVATDDEATISRLSPTPIALAPIKRLCTSAFPISIGIRIHAQVWTVTLLYDLAYFHPEVGISIKRVPL
ncbi:Zinc finger, ZZ type protein [Ceratobasidium sp. AG-Ba]|nr:Zinc finger, ZZ type protein [Ceratobasidium sp. AG-Ba]